MKVDLAGGWNNVWGVIKGALGGFAGLLTAVGVIVVVAALVKWLWDKRRGGGGGGSAAVGWAIAVGSVLAAPGLIIPLILGIFDVVANAVINLVQKNK